MIYCVCVADVPAGAAAPDAADVLRAPAAPGRGRHGAALHSQVHGSCQSQRKKMLEGSHKYTVGMLYENIQTRI